MEVVDALWARILGPEFRGSTDLCVRWCRADPEPGRGPLRGRAPAGAAPASLVSWSLNTFTYLCLRVDHDATDALTLITRKRRDRDAGGTGADAAANSAEEKARVDCLLFPSPRPHMLPYYYPAVGTKQNNPFRRPLLTRLLASWRIKNVIGFEIPRWK